MPLIVIYLFHPCIFISSQEHSIIDSYVLGAHRQQSVRGLIMCQALCWRPLLPSFSLPLHFLDLLIAQRITELLLSSGTVAQS